MEELEEMLEGWRKLSFSNKFIEKDYFIQNDEVRIMIAVSVEKPFLFKTFTAKCPPDIHLIEGLTEKLEMKIDELI